MRRGGCEPSASTRHRIVDHFTALHEGFPPASITCATYQEPKGPYRTLGRITEIQYAKRTPKGLERYWHPFKPFAQPMAALDRHGNLVIWAGRYRVRTGGITDRARENVEAEFIPRKPESLSDLGTLQWIRYDSLHGESRPRTLRFSARDVLTYDEHGNLYVVKPTREVEMRRYSSRRGRGKRNPIEIRSGKGHEKAHFVDLAKASAGIGISTALWGEVASRLTPMSLTGYSRAGVQLIAGLGAAAISAAVFPKLPELALGIGAGGVIQGVVGGYNTYRAQRLITNPGGAAQLGPEGLPFNYAQVGRASCAVGVR
jgi:hypothetical protein